MQFPRLIYHATEDTRLVYSAQEFAQLHAVGWSLTPIPRPDPVAGLAARVASLEARLAALETPKCQAPDSQKRARTRS